MSKFSPLNGVTKAVIDPLNIVIKYKNLYIGLLHDKEKNYTKNSTLLSDIFF